MKYLIKIGEKLVYKTDDLQQALKIIVQIFHDGHNDVYLIGGKLGSWWRKKDANIRIPLH